MATPITEPPKATESNLQNIENLWNDREALLTKGIEPTLNRKGCTYHILGAPEDAWVSTLPESPLPLLDAGACYGVQTIHALSKRRDVIAMDMSEEHLTVLRQRVANLSGEHGRLVDTVCAKLPNRDVIQPASVSGILCSEVVHFLHPGEMRPQFDHFFRWLCPGGRLVLTVGAWPVRIKSMMKAGLTLRDGRTADEALKLLDIMSPSQIVDASPGVLYMPKGSPWIEKIGEFLYHLSTVELRELATSAGFEVEDARYYCSGKYGENDGKEETAILVARKPE